MGAIGCIGLNLHVAAARQCKLVVIGGLALFLQWNIIAWQLGWPSNIVVGISHLLSIQTECPCASFNSVTPCAHLVLCSLTLYQPMIIVSGSISHNNLYGGVIINIPLQYMYVVSASLTLTMCLSQMLWHSVKWTLFQWGSKVSTNWSNTWKHACCRAFMYTLHGSIHVFL